MSIPWITPNEYVDGTLSDIPTQKRGKGNPRTTQRIDYADVICTFDIETSRLQDIEQSIMYVWVLHLHHHCTVVGRTWEELRELFEQFRRELGERRLVVFIHNLSYEFQFLRAIHEWQTDEVFAVRSRKVLKANLTDFNLEFRCSYLHSNMSLAEYTTKMDVQHKKLDGEQFNYKIVRYPWTPLTDGEITYCLHDVIGLAEAIEKEMTMDNDNLYTFPLTSTGYVRRDVKRAMHGYNRAIVRDMLPDYKTYTLLDESFRGGNTHANRYFANVIINDVKSSDRSSSYPDVVCNCKFPMSAFQYYGEATPDELTHLMVVRKRAVLMRVAISGLRLRDQYFPCPYLSKDKCRHTINGAFDNGRVLFADYLETTINDVDFQIILSEYDFDDLAAFDVYIARYGKLPQPIIDETIRYYKRKTELKDVPGKEVYYMKEKNKLNSIYGMMAQKPVKQSIIYNNGEWNEDDKNPEELLEKSNSRAFLSFAWGCWVTSWARLRLEEGIRLAGRRMIYTDTDSVKYIGEIDWSHYNNERIADSEKSGAWADDKHGTRHYMGVFEQEKPYSQFKTLGAKKYAYVWPDGKLGVTIAGVTKRTGGIELERFGGLDAFADGFTFVESGGIEAVYNDNPETGTIVVDGHELSITPNIVLRDSTYTLGITEEYRALLTNSTFPLDIWAGL